MRHFIHQPNIKDVFKVVLALRGGAALFIHKKISVHTFILGRLSVATNSGQQGLPNLNFLNSILKNYIFLKFNYNNIAGEYECTNEI